VQAAGTAADDGVGAALELDLASQDAEVAAEEQDALGLGDAGGGEVETAGVGADRPGRGSLIFS
jgi:hypothetical protein